MIRLSSSEKRNQIISDLSKKFSSSYKSFQIDKFKKVIHDQQRFFLDRMDIKQGIGKNLPLSENIFVIITCILNQIPLIITGNPGSSKTLAMNLILKSFKGKLSSNSFFKNYPTFLSYYYQGSEQSTSKGIEKVYKKAHEEQEKKDRNVTQIVVVFDEIGLAEKSPNNPLKVMHSLLEPPRVATVGLSNWSLDASKMNRVITLSRTSPGEEDLKKSAESIA